MSSHPEFVDSPRTRKPWGMAKFVTIWFVGAIAAIFAGTWLSFVISDAAFGGNFVPAVALLMIVGLLVWDNFFRADPVDEDVEQRAFRQHS